MAMDLKAISEQVRRILTAPDVDLATISSKKVRKVLAESFGAGAIKENKEAIDALIIDAFNGIATAAGATQPNPPSQPEQQSNAQAHVKVEDGATTAGRSNGAPAASSSKQRDRQKQQQQPDTDSDGQGDDDDDASGSESEPAKPSKSYSNLKQSPQKKKVSAIDAVASDSFPASSPSVPLSLGTGLTDEEYARKLQEELNRITGGRSTRGSGSARASSSKKGKRGKATQKSKSSGSGAGNGSSKRYRSKAYIDDSDLEGEDRSLSDDDDGGQSEDDAPKKKKRKASGGGGTGGGYNKELALSEPLQKVCGQPTMSRPQIVKQLWVYIREHELQDPKKKSDIINDELFKEIFGVDKMTMFSMNKYLSKNVSPIDG